MVTPTLHRSAGPHEAASLSEFNQIATTPLALESGFEALQTAGTVQVSTTVGGETVVGTVTVLEGGVDAWELPTPTRPTRSPAASRAWNTRRELL
jgi:hypothetical protein